MDPKKEMRNNTKDILDLNFIGNDPGASRYGNFINYYQFNSVEMRVQSLSDQILDNLTADQLVILDIGCNTGMLTHELYVNLTKGRPDRPVYILGVDIDPVLIERADQLNTCASISFECVNFMNNKARARLLSTFLKQFRLDKFNCVFCFSVTMWIHLNYGDDGLREFLLEMSKLSDNIVLEVQPWKCYKSAIRRLKRQNCDFPLFQQLAVRENVEEFIDQVLNECGYKSGQELKYGPKTKWGRSILLYTKR